MPFIRVYSKMDEKFRLLLPRGIRKALDIRPCDKLELTVVGMNKVRKLLVAKERRRLIR